MPPRTTEPSQGRKPWPSHFIVRTTGEIVPLIAVDELPVGTTLVDVPRTLGLEATKGMLNLGLQRSSGCHYQMSSTSFQTKTVQIPTQPKNFVSRNAPTAVASTRAPESTSSSEDETEVTSPPPPTTTRAPVPTTQSQVRNPIPSLYANPQNNTPLCRHWCTHGICKWGQQCRYKHIMPMTLHGIQEVGLRDWPAWYRGLNPGYFVDSRDSPVAGRDFNLRGVQRGCPRPRREEREKRVGHGGERRAAVAKGEDLGDEILRKLKALEKEKDREKEIIAKSKTEHEKERVRKAAVAEGNAAAMERATASNTLRWEDDDSEAEELERERVEEKKKKLESAGEGSKKLVDV